MFNVTVQKTEMLYGKLDNLFNTHTSTWPLKRWQNPVVSRSGAGDSYPETYDLHMFAFSVLLACAAQSSNSRK